MQSLVPRAIANIEFGTEGDKCAVAMYKTTKMAEKRGIPRCSYPEILSPVPEQFQGQNRRETSPPCIGVFLCTLWIDSGDLHLFRFPRLLLRPFRCGFRREGRVYTGLYAREAVLQSFAAI